ncbi:MAG: hypothetical protein GW949_08150 [Spirochaetales bacterium]|nr:hypothetical protein [Spirochaetales bacterium]
MEVKEHRFILFFLFVGAILGTLILYFSAWALSLPLVLDSQFTILVAVFLGPSIGAALGFVVGILIVVLSDFPPEYSWLILSQIGLGLGLGFAFRQRAILTFHKGIPLATLSLVLWVVYETTVSYFLLFDKIGGYEDPLGITLTLAGLPLPIALLIGSLSRRSIETVIALFVAHILGSTHYGQELLALGYTDSVRGKS